MTEPLADLPDPPAAISRRAAWVRTALAVLVPLWVYPAFWWGAVTLGNRFAWGGYDVMILGLGPGLAVVIAVGATLLPTEDRSLWWRLPIAAGYAAGEVALLFGVLTLMGRLGFFA